MLGKTIPYKNNVEIYTIMGLEEKYYCLDIIQFCPCEDQKNHLKFFNWVYWSFIG